MTLHDFNILSREQHIAELTKCCGSSVWVQGMLEFIPADDLVELLEDAESVWYQCSEDDWKEAFAQHPKIGDTESLKKQVASTADAVTIGWAAGEQSAISNASEQVIAALAEGNRVYLEKFGYIFIVCATGKSAEEMMGMLQARLQNTAEEELEIAADEQNKITKLRIEKLLN